MPVIDDSDPVQERIEAHFLGRSGVTNKKMFAREALAVNGKIFAIFRLGEMVVKLPADEGRALIDAGEAEQFEPGPGRVMREWFTVHETGDEDRWLELAERSFDFVLSLQG